VKNIQYVYLAVGTGALGTAITFVLLIACQYYGIDLSRHLWLLAIPIGLALFLNVLFIELYNKFRKK